MRCDQFQERLNVALDERQLPTSDAALVQHASVCAQCDATLGMSVQLVNALDVERRANHEVVKTVDRGSAPTRSSNKLARSLFVAAAMILIAFSVAQFGASTVISPESLSPSMVAVAVPPIPEAPTVAAVASAPEVDVLDLPGMIPDVDQIPEPSAFVHQPILSLGLLSTAEWNYPVSEVNMPFGTRLPVESSWIQVVSDGMVPVQQSMTKTLAAIRRSLSS